MSVTVTNNTSKDNSTFSTDLMSSHPPSNSSADQSSTTNNQHGKVKDNKIIELNRPKIAQSAVASQIPVLPSDVAGYYADEIFPNVFDENEEPLDLRRENTWTSQLGGIHPLEMLETQLVNQFAPFTLVNCLLPIMIKSKQKHKFIINVSAMEGVFSSYKRSAHPHTNMSKAALNMLTKTSAPDLAKHNIYMNSVDTGWCTDEFPVGHPSRDGQPPLNEADGAARVLDPIFDGLKTRNFVVGQFLKDYKSYSWSN